MKPPVIFYASYKTNNFHYHVVCYYMRIYYTTITVNSYKKFQ